MEKKTFDPAEFLGVQVLSPLEKKNDQRRLSTTATATAATAAATAK